MRKKEFVAGFAPAPDVLKRWRADKAYRRRLAKKHNLASDRVHVDIYLSQKAFGNSVKHFGSKEAQARFIRERMLKTAIKRDKRSMPHSYTWPISFNAGINELNRFYRLDLIRFLKKENALHPNLKVVEIGAGTGKAAGEIVTQLPGVDYTATGLTRVPEWYNQPSKIKWKVMHSMQILRKFKPGSIDFIHSNLGLSFNEPADITRTLEQCRGVLKKNGKLLFTCESNFEIPEGFKVLYKSHPSQGKGDDYMQYVFLLQKK